MKARHFALFAALGMIAGALGAIERDARHEGEVYVPAPSQRWLDTSQAPAALKQYDGAQWQRVCVAPTTVATLNATSTSGTFFHTGSTTCAWSR